MSKTIPMYAPWTVIDGGLSELEETNAQFIDTGVVPSEEDLKDLVYLVVTPRGLIGAFNDINLLNKCMDDFPEAQLLELKLNVRKM